MKRLIYFFMIVSMLCLSACNHTEMDEKTTTESTETTKKTEETTTEFIENEADIKKYMFMLEGHLYVDTGETESRVGCGTMDRGFEKTISIDEIPNEDGEANFKSEYNGAQYWDQENRMVSYIDGKRHVFAYNENNLDGVTMNVTDNTNTTLTFEISNQRTDEKEICFGDDYVVWKLDESVGEWRQLDTIIDEYGFNSIAYVVEKEKTVTKEIDFKWLYGELDKGTYRIVKTILIDSDDDLYETFWYLAEFSVE